MKFKSFTMLLVLTLTMTSTFSYADEALAGTAPSSEPTNVLAAQSEIDGQSLITEDPKSDEASEQTEINENVTNPVEPAVKPVASSTVDHTKEIRTKKVNAAMSFINSKNPGLSDATAKKVAEAAMSAAETNHVELSLVLAVMWKESTFTPTAVNPSGCYGLMQVSKTTGAGFGYSVSDLLDPYRNAQVGAKLLKGQINKFGSTVLGLTAYNAGGGNVSRGNYTTAYANNVLAKQNVINTYINNYMNK